MTRDLQSRLPEVPSATIAGHERARQYRVLLYTSGIAAAFSALYCGTYWANGVPAGVWLEVVCTLGFVAIILALRRGADPFRTARWYGPVGVLSIFGTIYLTGGFVSPAMPWIISMPIVMVLLAGKRQGMLYMVLCIAYLALLVGLQEQGYVFPSLSESALVYLNQNIFSSLAGLGILMYLAATVFQNSKNAALQKLAAANELLAGEKQRSDELLHNILPDETVQELKATGKTTARSYELVTVLFADFKDFTIHSEQMTPEELVSGIDEYFEAFDRIVEKQGVEKIKTVGDAYICAGGLPEPDPDNPAMIVRTGLDMLDAVADIGESRKARGLRSFEIRIGIHSGPLVAGVVGIKKFAYDIWGDTVNTAARMQQHGEPGQVNISAATCDLIREQFACAPRGLIAAKNKGEVEMYFVGAKQQPDH